ncbi:ABC transporter substrate-binding protein [Streptococcus moroccensis]|uniref:Iron complex transport system substrate-binding protein n=1 Tax=Streptococcus moroccensis TaxID=1451356 RepID=A0ABT9YTZ8_9STRE|nr:ABC transporter substrate-binding protein [Streptococcus moroccensis]MDQ0222590.1 iron complex transport system substrate-binding protein [Streptococcus moroccensis]
MNLKKIGITLLLLPTTYLLASCTNNKTTTTTTQEDKEIKINNYGREVTVTHIPENVITIGPNASELFVALGLEDKIIGNALDNHSRGPLPEYEKGYAKIPELTYGSPTREAVLSSGADFIYGIDWEFGEEGLNIDELNDYGITTYLNSAHTIDQVFQEIEDLGMIFDIKEEASNLIEDQSKRLERVQASIDWEPVSVLVYDSGNNGVFTASQKNFETRLIEASGGVNIFSDLTEKDWVTVSAEEVLSRNPEVIIIHDYDAQSAEEKIAELKNDPVLNQVKAVKDEAFVVISLESALPGPRTAYIVETLSKAFEKVGNN